MLPKYLLIYYIIISNTSKLRTIIQSKLNQSSTENVFQIITMHKKKIVLWKENAEPKMRFIRASHQDLQNPKRIIKVYQGMNGENQTFYDQTKSFRNKRCMNKILLRSYVWKHQQLTWSIVRATPAYSNTCK